MCCACDKRGERRERAAEPPPSNKERIWYAADGAHGRLLKRYSFSPGKQSIVLDELLGLLGEHNVRRLIAKIGEVGKR